MKKILKKYLPSIIILALIATNLLSLYYYNRERERIKNAFMPTFSEDYLTKQLTLTDIAKSYEKKGITLFQVEARSEEELQKEDYHFRYDVPLVLQNPTYPNGCESASATMLLNYLGINVTLEKFVDTYLVQRPVYERDSKRYGPNPSEAFAGDPADVMYGWGTLEPTMKRAISESLDDLSDDPYYSVLGNEAKMSLDVFASTYRRPFIIWTTTDYTPVKEVYQWYSYDGNRTYTYAKNSHTVLVTGMDDNYYYLNDPLKDESNIKVPKEKLEISFDSAGRQAIAIDSSPIEKSP